MALRSSWGLALDLGDEALSESTIQALYQGFWSQVGPPQFTMGNSAEQVPQAAEGVVSLAGQTGKAYTKFERDSLGYPPGWQVPVVFSLSLFGFAENLPDNPVLVNFLLDYVRTHVPEFRMAVIGNLGSYYLNTEMINAAWVTMQQQDVNTLILSAKHPLARSLSGGTAFSEQHVLFSVEQLQQLWQPEVDFEQRHKAYKQAISAQLHTELLPLEWESPHDN